MPILTVEESNYAGPIPADTILPAKITAVRQVMARGYKNDDGSDAFRIEFTFVIEDAESLWDGVKLWGDTTNKLINHPDCKLWQWAQEILVSELPPGFQLDTDLLVGNPCRIVVGMREYEKDGQNKIHNFVGDVMRPREAAVFAGINEEEPF
jgi:hypothetical protein